MVKNIYQVCEAGTLAVNGDYEYYGTSDGVPSYKKTDANLLLYRIDNAGKEWTIGNLALTIVYYNIASSESTPPLTCWSAVTGTNPLPVLIFKTKSTVGEKEIKTSYGASDNRVLNLVPEKSFVASRYKVGL